MKKIYLTVISLLLAFQFTYAQWTTNSANTITSTTNLIGIGTAIPVQPLEVQINTNGTSGIVFTNSNTGSSARARYVLNNGVNSAIINLNSTTFPTDPNSLAICAPFNGGGSLMFETGGNEKMRILGNGNVLVGKTTQLNSAYLLDVAGTVRANGIMVNALGADFVFDHSYHLIPLADLKAYIDQNHHLPEIASAKEMHADGLNVGENQIKLLQKVEELTLYAIAADKRANEDEVIIAQQKEASRQQQISLTRQKILLAQQQETLLQMQNQLKIQQKEIEQLKNK